MIGGGAGRLSGAFTGGATADPIRLLLATTGGFDGSTTGLGFLVGPVGMAGNVTGTRLPPQLPPRVTLVASGKN